MTFQTNYIARFIKQFISLQSIILGFNFHPCAIFGTCIEHVCRTCKIDILTLFLALKMSTCKGLKIYSFPLWLVPMLVFSFLVRKHLAIVSCCDSSAFKIVCIPKTGKNAFLHKCFIPRQKIIPIMTLPEREIFWDP